MQLKIIYVYDALCGWCYGFSPVMERLAENYGERLHITILSGGMIIGERSGPIGKVAGYIGEAYKTVENRTGIKFGKDFLEGILKEGTAEFSSLQPAIALCAVKELARDKSLEFAGLLQKAIYFDGIAPNELKDYVPYAQKVGINKEDFLAAMQNDRYLEQAKREFDVVQKLGIQGFPTLLLETEERLYRLTSGYLPYEQLAAVIEAAWEQTVVSN
ncbi:MAG: DsbA family protein [Saprospiraceae bacterium]|nr:MAG: DsbA family protein [Saprospiraceae bacterium]